MDGALPAVALTDFLKQHSKITIVKELNGYANSLEIDDVTGSLLAALSDEASVTEVINSLISHAIQGVYRPGAWERPWVCQAFGEDFLDRLEPGDPFGRTSSSLFQKPR